MACVQQQADFQSLAVSESESEEEIATHEDSTSPCQIACKASSPCNKEEYVPVNFIHDEVRAMILGWEAREATRLGSQLEMPTTTWNDLNFEPVRPAENPKTPEPPKKFIRAVSRRKLGSGNQAVAPVAKLASD